MEDKAIYYPVTGCLSCQDGFREFFIFCYQNKISYKFEREIKNTLNEPIIKFGNRWFRGDEMMIEFKKAWREVKNAAK